MRKHYRYMYAPPPEELIASFGEAQLVKTLDGKIELRGGSPDDRARAREWMDRFLAPPKLKDEPPKSL